MVNIIWVAVAMFGGMILGIFMAALLEAGKDDDDRGRR